MKLENKWGGTYFRRLEHITSKFVPWGNKFTRKYVPGGTYLGGTYFLVYR